MFVSVMCLSGNVPNISWVLTYRVTYSEYWIVFVISYSFSCRMTFEFAITCWTVFFRIIPVCTGYFTCCRKFVKACMGFCIVNNRFYLLNFIFILIYWLVLYQMLSWRFISSFSCF